MGKKKLFYFISTCLLTLIISGGIYYYNVYNSIKVIDIHANYVTYDTEEALNNNADIILYGSPVNKFEDREHVNRENKDGYIEDFYTITEFNVEKVLKNSTTLQINEKDLFNIIEPIGLVQQIGGKKVLQMNSYESMEENTKYIVYLKSNKNGGYSVINMANGRFNMDEDLSTDYNKLTPDSLDNSKHIDIKKDVIEKYWEICRK